MMTSIKQLINLILLLIIPWSVFAANTITIKQEAVAIPIKVGGTVIAKQQATLTAQSQGRVKLIMGKEGDAFKKGDILIQLDKSALLANRQAALYNVQSASAQYTRELNSPSSSTAPGGMGFPSMMDNIVTNPMQSFMGTRDTSTERRADLISKQALIQNANSALKQADAQIRDSLTIAPFDGIIINSMVENGDIIQPGQQLLTFSNINDLEILVDVPARLRKALKVGTSLTVTLDDIETPFSSIISRVFPTINQQTMTVRMKLSIPKNIETTAGIYATVSVPDSRGGGKKLIAIPKSAINYRGSIAMVTLMSQEQQKTRLVRLGETLIDDRIEVISGLKPGDTIVVP